MLTLHVPESGDAVAVDGDRIVAVGPYEELTSAHPGTRERRWPGTLGAGRCEPDAAALLEAAYHPDPREAEELGTEPVTGDALSALGMTDTRWGHSARRGVQRLLRDGVTAVVGPFSRPEVRTAVRRAGLTELAAPREPVLAVGVRADFAVFSGGRCVATVLGGRLVYRAR